MLPVAGIEEDRLLGMVAAADPVKDESVGSVAALRQKLAPAFGYNTTGIPIAAGLLYPFFGIVLSPMIATAAMAASSLSVVSNASRLRRARITPCRQPSPSQRRPASIPRIIPAADRLGRAA